MFSQLEAGGDVAAGGDDKVGVVGIGFHDLDGLRPDGVGGAVAELAGGIHVAHHQHVGGHAVHHVLHVHRVAEVVAHGAQRDHIVQHAGGGVAAVVVDDGEVVVLHRVNDARLT